MILITTVHNLNNFSANFSAHIAMIRGSGKSISHLKGVRRISSFSVHPSMQLPFGVQPPVTQACSGDVVSSELSNGTRVVTHDMESTSAFLGIYVKAGAMYDPKSIPGMNYALRWCFLGSNMENSIFQNDKAFRSAGASYEHAEVQKKFLAFKLESARDSWKAPLSHMLSCMCVPRFAQTDILKVQDQMENETEEQRWKFPREYCIEQAEQLAFKGQPLGNPRHIKPYFVEELTSKAMQDHWAQTFTPSRVTIVGINVEHQDLVACCEDHAFSHDANAPHFRDASMNSAQNILSNYQGGHELEFQEKRDKEMSTKPYMENETIGALVWKAHGVQTVKEYAASLVLHQILAMSLQEGTKVSSGMVDHGIRSFYVPFNEVGLLGMTYRESPSNALNAIKEILSMQRKMRGESVSASILTAAKARAKTRLHHEHFELRRDYGDYLALNLSAGKSRSSAAEVYDAIHNVTTPVIQRALATMNSASPCMYNMGDVYHLPSLRQLGITRDISASPALDATFAISS